LAENARLGSGKGSKSVTELESGQAKNWEGRVLLQDLRKNFGARPSKRESRDFFDSRGEDIAQTSAQKP